MDKITFHVDIPQLGECWEWMGAMAKHGRRGRFRLGKNKIMAYRAGWILAGHELGEETLDHRCTNPGCVNPAHMVPCSYKENQWRDKNVAKPVVLKGAA